MKSKTISIDASQLADFCETINNKSGIGIYLQYRRLIDYCGHNELRVERYSHIKEKITTEYFEYNIGDEFINITFDVLELTKENVKYCITGILKNGIKRKELSSTLPGQDGCNRGNFIYSLAFIKQNFFGINKNRRSKAEKFRDILVELEKEKFLKCKTNAAGAIIGIELLDRTKSKAEKFFEKLVKCNFVSSAKICGTSKFLYKDYKNGIKYKEQILLNLNPESDIMLFEFEDVKINDLYRKNKDLLLKSNLIDVFNEDIKEVANNILTDLRQKTKMKLNCDNIATICQSKGRWSTNYVLAYKVDISK